MRVMALKDQLPFIFSFQVILVTTPRVSLFVRLLWLLSLFTEEEFIVLLCTRQK